MNLPWGIIKCCSMNFQWWFYAYLRSQNEYSSYPSDWLPRDCSKFCKTGHVWRWRRGQQKGFCHLPLTAKLNDKMLSTHLHWKCPLLLWNWKKTAEVVVNQHVLLEEKEFSKSLSDFINLVVKRAFWEIYIAVDTEKWRQTGRSKSWGCTIYYNLQTRKWFFLHFHLF